MLEPTVEITGGDEVCESIDGGGRAVFADGEAGVEEVAEGDGTGEREPLGLQALELLRRDEIKEQNLLQRLGDATQGGRGVELGQNPFDAPVGRQKQLVIGVAEVDAAEGV